MSARLDEACAEVGRAPPLIRRSVQLFLHPQQDGQVERQLAVLSRLRERGCQHAVLSYYQPPTVEQLRSAQDAAAVKA